MPSKEQESSLGGDVASTAVAGLRRGSRETSFYELSGDDGKRIRVLRKSRRSECSGQCRICHSGKSRAVGALEEEACLAVRLRPLLS